MQQAVTIDHEQIPQASDTTWQRSGRLVQGGYFGYFAAVGAFAPFAALYYRELGFNGYQVGLLTALPSLWAALFGPFLGAIADSLAVHRLVLRIALAVATVLALLMSQVTGFLPILVIVGILSLSTVPIPSLLDSYALTVSERTSASYGSLRVWGSVGYMAVVLVMGWVMGDHVSKLFLVGYAICLGLTLLSTRGLPHLADRHPRSLFGGLAELRHNRPFMLLMAVAYLLSSGAATMNVYLGVHIQGLGGSANLVGIAFAISAASELPIVALGGRLLARFGTIPLIVLALLVYAARFVAFSLITVPEWILPIQLFHGLSYGAFLMASVTLAYRQAGRSHAATAQALLSAMSFGFGSITGSLLGGAGLDTIGTVGLFRVSAVIMLAALAILVIGDRRIGLVPPEPEPAASPG